MSISARICLVAPEFIGPFPNGGVGTACYWEATTLAAAGYDVTVLYTGPTEHESPEHWERVFADGPFRYVDLWRWAAAGAGLASARLQQPCAEAATADLVYRYLRQRPFDLLLFQEFLGHGCRALQARRSGEAFGGTRAAVTLHSCRQWIYEGMRRLPASRADLAVDFLERESARLADAIVAPSFHMAQWASSHWALDSAPDVVPYCYDPRHQRPAGVIEHHGPFTDLVFFGRLETRKGLHLLCEALRDYPEARGHLRRVTFLGKPSAVEGRPSEAYIHEMLDGLDGIEVRLVSTLGSLEALEWLEAQRQALVIAPSIVDNLPYALIELFARQLPLLTTRIGGIPEIVGEANAHLLAEPTPAGVARLLAAVDQSGRLTIDYRDGYRVAAANHAHVAWVRSLLATAPVPAAAPAAPTCEVVLVDAADDTLAEAHAAFVDADPSAAMSVFRTWDGWRRSASAAPAVFASRHVVPHAGMTARLVGALAHPRVAAVTSAYDTVSDSGVAAVAPLGASLEAGWTENVFGGPCFAARGDALDVLRDMPGPRFAFWPAYALLACAELELALLPDAWYGADPVADSIDTVEQVIDIYRRSAPDRFDLGWVLKFASAPKADASPASQAPSPVGRALHGHLCATSDLQVERWAGLTGDPQEDPFLRDMHHLRLRLAALVREWESSAPRVFVYGAGLHAKLMLTLAPDVGRFIAGFIDRRPLTEFLGKPCLRPDQMTPAMADVVLYASREFEREMHARLASLDVRHVLIYGESPAMPPETTSARLGRRFGHRAVPLDALREMYHPPDWVRGGCSGGDVAFLLEMVSAVAPHVMLELGVAAGTSSAALLFALDRLPATAAARTLHSCDVRATCYFDPARATGAAVADLYPQHRADWRLDTDADARRIRARFAEGSVDLCFIDANHGHPWPLLDLLHVAPLVRSEGWVILHDIELPRLHPQFQVHGPQWLFEMWPFNKIHGVGDAANIGAIQLPPRLSDLEPVARALLARPWEQTPTTWDIDLPVVFADLARALAPRLARPASALAG